MIKGGWARLQRSFRFWRYMIFGGPLALRRDSGHVRRISFALLGVVLFAFVALVSPVAAHAQSASALYKRAEAAELKDDPVTAYEFYREAYRKNPKDLKYKAAVDRIQFVAAATLVNQGQKLRDKGDLAGALTAFLRATQVDPSNEQAAKEARATQERIAREEGAAPPASRETLPQQLIDAAGPLELKPVSNDPIVLHMSEDSKVVYQTIGKLSGLNVLFDPDYVSKRISVDLNQVSLMDGMRIVGTLSGTFYRPVTSNTIFVAQNNPQKRGELDTQAVQTFYLSNVAAQNDISDIQNALRQLLVGGDANQVKLFAVPGQNAIVMRGTPDQLLLAQQIIDDLDKQRAEVVVDVAVMQVNRDKIRNIGITFPQSVSVQLQPTTASTTTTTPTPGNPTTPTTPTTPSNGLTLDTFKHLNATNFGVTVGTITANLLLNDADTKILQNPQIRASDAQEAKLKIGQRVPVATSSYQAGAATAVVSSLVNTQFQYIDVGVNITITPLIHTNHDVTLKVTIEVSTVDTFQNVGGITEPVIGQRTIQQVIRLKEGEANLLGGILQKQDNITIAGTPGLGELPLLKYFFSSTNHEVINNEIVFMMIPHIVRTPDITPLNRRVLDTGTARSVELRRVSSIQPAETPGQSARPPAQMTPAPTPAPPPSAPAAPPTVPGNTAQTAAVNAVTALAAKPDLPPPAAGPGVLLGLTPGESTHPVGSTFQVAVALTGGSDIYSVP
ncbi:MAG TPA: secretin N-terminal domain-containing protein, partial [Acidobacteriaceae bacterium]|nr:secretin N-terminal domain-containing protein [Acidobacteriaceae bacterium]